MSWQAKRLAGDVVESKIPPVGAELMYLVAQPHCIERS